MSHKYDGPASSCIAFTTPLLTYNGTGKVAQKLTRWGDFQDFAELATVSATVCIHDVFTWHWPCATSVGQVPCTQLANLYSLCEKLLL